jgi:hypothetical protein
VIFALSITLPQKYSLYYGNGQLIEKKELIPFSWVAMNLSLSVR